MLYREIGKTGKKAGIIGMGCEHLDGKPYDQVHSTIQAAVEAGINYYDIFMPGTKIREDIAHALNKKREDVLIQGHLGSAEVDGRYDINRDMPTVRKSFEEYLRLLGGYVDFGMLFFIDSEKDFKEVFDGGVADYALKLKEKGCIHHIGFSSHKPDIAMKVVRTGLPDIMMFSINLAFDSIPSELYALQALGTNWEGAEFLGLDTERSALYKLCEQEGVGISVMKTLGAGKLVSAEHTPFSKPMSVPQCIQYALDRPAVFSTLIGCKSAEEVQTALTYLESDAQERDYTDFLKEQAQGFAGTCVYCDHCQPCPVGIDISTVNKYLDIARLDEDNIPPSIEAHYRSLSARGADCIACGNCEARCPFGVPIIENMRQAESLFDA